MMNNHGQEETEKIKIRKSIHRRDTLSMQKILAEKMTPKKKAKSSGKTQTFPLAFQHLIGDPEEEFYQLGLKDRTYWQNDLKYNKRPLLAQTVSQILFQQGHLPLKEVQRLLTIALAQTSLEWPEFSFLPSPNPILHAYARGLGLHPFLYLWLQELQHAKLPLALEFILRQCQVKGPHSLFHQSLTWSWDKKKTKDSECFFLFDSSLSLLSHATKEAELLGPTPLTPQHLRWTMLGDKIWPTRPFYPFCGDIFYQLEDEFLTLQAPDQAKERAYSHPVLNIPLCTLTLPRSLKAPSSLSLKDLVKSFTSLPATLFDVETKISFLPPSLRPDFPKKFSLAAEQALLNFYTSERVQNAPYSHHAFQMFLQHGEIKAPYFTLYQWLHDVEKNQYSSILKQVMEYRDQMIGSKKTLPLFILPFIALLKYDNRLPLSPRDWDALLELYKEMTAGQDLVFNARNAEGTLRQGLQGLMLKTLCPYSFL
jgi:hypothetical protein